MSKYIVELAFPIWIEAKSSEDAEMKAIRAATAGVFDDAMHKSVEVLNHARLLDEDSLTKLPN